MSDIQVTGPVSGGRHGRPFGASTRDLSAEGYVEEEYFFSGQAPVYKPVGELGTDGRWSATRNGSTPFQTRALVRRPTDPTRFNGTVVVEWNNVSAGFEIFEEGETNVIFDEGFAYVGVSAQRVGVHGHDVNSQGLRAWDAERYSRLHVADDAASFGIFSELAQAVGPRRIGLPDPLGGLHVQRLIATGGSQSAGRLATYINAIQPLERLFDAFLLFGWFGAGASIDDPRTLDLSESDGLARMNAHPGQIRDDLSVPVIIVNSECETLWCARVRQSDTDRFRFWEVAGAGHAALPQMERTLAKVARDGIAIPLPSNGSSEGVAPSMVPYTPVIGAALAHVQNWITRGDAPPVQPRIEIESGGARIKRDADGNAIGGIRLPEMEATITRNIGCVTGSETAYPMGVSTPLPAAIVKQRYPDQESYLRAFTAAADRAIQAGVLRPHDAAEGLERARQVQLPDWS